MIVDDPKKGIVESNLIYYDGKSSCKHLRGERVGEFSCAIHSEAWYKETPCFLHSQIECSEDTPCRIGEHILNQIKKKLITGSSDNDNTQELGS